MIARVLGCIFLVLCLVEAHVDFVTSRVYDEFDFKGQSTVTIDGLCSGSCYIFASITPESKRLASNLLIQLPKGFISIADIAAKIDPATNKKSFTVVNRTYSLTIKNANAQFAAGPLVLYIIDSDFYTFHPEFNQVYEADGFNHSIATFPAYLTVMSARPFTLHQEPRHTTAERQGLMATMTGLDELMHYGPCWNLYFEIAYLDHHEFTWEVNGPIVSVYWDNGFNQHDLPPVHLNATIGITNNRPLDTSGWIGSPGAHGCVGKQPYRSSLYDLSAPVHGTIASENVHSIAVMVATNSDADVIVTDQDSDASYRVPSTAGHNPTYLPNFITKNVTVNWTPNGTGNDYFIVQWNATIPN